MVVVEVYVAVLVVVVVVENVVVEFSFIRTAMVQEGEYHHEDRPRCQSDPSILQGQCALLICNSAPT